MITYNEMMKNQKIDTFINKNKTNEMEEKKMENNEMEIGIGTKEMEKLKPALVQIKGVRIDKVGDKQNKKVVCICQHPNKTETIEISTVKYEKNKSMEIIGLWLNKDEDSLIRMGSALAIFLEFVGAKKINELVEKQINTAIDDKGYLCFKCY